MDAEKVTKVELEDITPEKKTEDEDGEKSNLLETTGDVYQTLDNSKEDIYSKIATSACTTKDIKKKARLYWRTSIVLLVVCLLLLAVVLALAMKLREAGSVQSCPDRVEIGDKSDNSQTCSPQLCQDMYPALVFHNQGSQCSECGKNWLKFENSCYFISVKRLSWQKSREECQHWGGDLAVINNELVQKTLTSSGYMLYWIGLSYTETQKWMWIDNTTVTQSYWASDNHLNNNQGQCVLLKGRMEHKKNWYLNSCQVTSHYICQRHLK